jgi:hypothetical protein
MKIEPITGNHLDEAADLLACSFQSLRKKSTSLSSVYENAELTTIHLEKILQNGAIGAVGMENGRMLGFLLGEIREDAYFGRSLWGMLGSLALA